MKKIDSLNLVPFIDIMLVLLVIVLVSASFIVQSNIKVDIPQIDSQTTQSTQDKQSKNITITESGEFYLDSTKLDFAELKAKIEDFDKETQVIIKGDRKSDLEIFLELTTMLRDRQITDIYVITTNKN